MRNGSQSKTHRVILDPPPPPLGLKSTYLITQPLHSFQSRGVGRGGAGGARAHPKFGRSVNPIQTREADCAPHTTTRPPGFKKLSTPLQRMTEDEEWGTFIVSRLIDSCKDWSEMKRTMLGVGHCTIISGHFLTTTLIAFTKLRFWRSFWRA